MSYSETQVPNDGAHHGHPTHATEKMPQRTWAESSEKATKEIVFGSVAGMCSKVFEYPFDTVKVRLQAQPDGIPRQYQGPLDCFQQSIRRDGFLSLYRGLTAPMIGAAVENSSLFFSVRPSCHFIDSRSLNTCSMISRKPFSQPTSTTPRPTSSPSLRKRHAVLSPVPSLPSFSPRSNSSNAECRCLSTRAAESRACLESWRPCPPSTARRACVGSGTDSWAHFSVRPAVQPLGSVRRRACPCGSASETV